jgi:hypothetical protein
MVAHGQPRSLAEVAGLGHRWMASSPTVLPKLAVLQGEDRPCRARPADPVPRRGYRSADGVRDRTGPEPQNEAASGATAGPHASDEQRTVTVTGGLSPERLSSHVRHRPRPERSLTRFHTAETTGP